MVHDQSRTIKNNFPRNVVFYLLIICCVFPPLSPLSAQEEIERDFHDYLDLEDCTGSWDILWPDFLEGSSDAAAAIAVFIFHRGLMPPRFSHDSGMNARYLAFFSFRAVDISDETKRSLASPILLLRESYSGLSNRIHLFDSCLPYESPSQICLDRLLEYNVVPDLENIKAEIEAAETAGISATCIEMPE